MGGKSAAPEAPNYVGQAQATAQGNLNAARAQTSANRMDQVTPYGTIKYTQSGGQFDQAGYDAAKARYDAQQAQIQSNPGLATYWGKTGELIAAPDRNSFMPNPDQWSSQIQLSDTGQQLLDAYNRTSLGLAGLQGTAMNNVQNTLGQPFDMSGLNPGATGNIDNDIHNYYNYVNGANDDIRAYQNYVQGLQGGNTGMAAWDKATDLVRQRQNPQLDAQQAALDAKLANQGLTPGSAGWGVEQQNFARTRNDADIVAQQAGLAAQNQFYNQGANTAGLMGQGIGYRQNNAAQVGQGVGLQFQNALLNNATRQQQLTERSTLRQMPLNELNALRSGAQVTNPTFSTPGMQGQTSGPDLMGAVNSQYGAQVNQANAQNAQAASNTQAGVGLASTAIMAAAFY